MPWYVVKFPFSKVVMVLQVGNVEVAESSTPNIVKNDKPDHRTSAPQSYDISPYQCSDDEEEAMDEIPNKKFVPTWARLVMFGSFRLFLYTKLFGAPFLIVELTHVRGLEFG